MNIVKMSDMLKCRYCHGNSSCGPFVKKLKQIVKMLFYMRWFLFFNKYRKNTHLNGKFPIFEITV